jgi:DNA end-binding protein Ku
MAKAFWKGVISFGMVAIPVKMLVATEPATTRFSILHKKCHNKLKQMWYCPQDKEYLTLQDSIRGYQYGPDKYVVFDEKDFEKVPIKTQHSINISGFIDAGEIDPIYYRGSHYLEPDELGVKPFSLLRDALKKSHKMGIAKVTFQHQEHLCCLRPFENILILHTMFFYNEILPREELNGPTQKSDDEQMKMAVSLISTMTRKFQPEDYKDEYHIALQKLVEAKIRGQELTAPKEKPKPVITDLMEALRTSIESAKKETASVARTK